MSSLVTPFLCQTISSISSVIKDGYLDKTFSPSYYNVKCRWQETTRQLVSSTGEQVLARAECWIEKGYSIKIGDKFVYNGEDFFVINYSTKYDIFGQAEYMKVHLQ